MMSISGLEPIVYISVQRETNSTRCLWKEGDAITTYQTKNYCSLKEMMAVIKLKQIRGSCLYSSVFFHIS